MSSAFEKSDHSAYHDHDLTVYYKKVFPFCVQLDWCFSSHFLLEKAFRAANADLKVTVWPEDLGFFPELSVLIRKFFSNFSLHNQTGLGLTQPANLFQCCSNGGIENASTIEGAWIVKYWAWRVGK